MDWQTRIEEKLDKIADKLEVLNVISAKQEVNINEHIRRTDLAEKNIEYLREELRPVQKHVFRVEGITKLVGLLGIMTTIVVSILEIFNNFKG